MNAIQILTKFYTCIAKLNDASLMQLSQQNNYGEHYFLSISKFPTLLGQKRFSKISGVPLSELIAVEKGSTKPFLLIWNNALKHVKTIRQYQLFLRSVMSTVDDFKEKMDKQDKYNKFANAIYTDTHSHESLAWATRQLGLYTYYPLNRALKLLDRIDPPVPHIPYDARERIMRYLKIYKIIHCKSTTPNVQQFVEPSNSVVIHHIKNICRGWHIRKKDIRALMTSNQPTMHLLKQQLPNIRTSQDYQEFLKLIIMSYGRGSLKSLTISHKQYRFAFLALHRQTYNYNNLKDLTLIITSQTDYHAQPLLKRLKQIHPHTPTIEKHVRLVVMKYFRLIRHLDNIRCVIPYTNILRVNNLIAISKLKEIATRLNVPKSIFHKLLRGDSRPIHKLLRQVLRTAQSIKDLHNFLRLIVKLDGGLKVLLNSPSEYRYLAGVLYDGKNTRKNLRTLIPRIHKLTGYPLAPLEKKMHEIIPAKAKTTKNQRSVILTYLMSYRNLYYSTSYCPIQVHFIMSMSSREAFHSLKEIAQKLELPLSIWDGLFNHPQELLDELRSSALNNINNITSLRQYLGMYLAAFPPLFNLTRSNYKQASMIDSAIHVDHFIIRRNAWIDITRQISKLTKHSLSPVIKQIKDNQIGAAD